jgi:hypothetical protein
VKLVNAGKLTSGGVFCTREVMKNNYLNRMTADVFGIYANSKQDAMYPICGVDSDGRNLRDHENDDHQARASFVRAAREEL